MFKLSKLSKLLLLTLISAGIYMCVPPDDTGEYSDNAAQAKLDSIREKMCPRLMSSAAEYYRNQDWENTARIYGNVVDLACDDFDPILAPSEEIYQYYSVAYEYLGKYDSAEYVILKGVQKLPENIALRMRLAYVYGRLNKFDEQIIEYERILDLDSSFVSVYQELNKIYKNNDQCEYQIDVIKRWLKIEKNNEIAQGELAIAYEACGRDPLEVYKDRWENNSTVISYGLDFADRLTNADRCEDAVEVLKDIIDLDNTSKLAYRKLGECYNSLDELQSASKAYEDLFKLDPRDQDIAIKISEFNIELAEYGKAMRWANKAIQVSGRSGKSIGQKGNVYYKCFQENHQSTLTNDDRVVANFACKYFLQAEEKGTKSYIKSRKWLEVNEVLFTRANWFMLDGKTKSQGFIKPSSSDYLWIEEQLTKDPKW